MDNLSLINTDKIVTALNTHSDDIPVKVYRALVTDIVTSLCTSGDVDGCIDIAARCGIIIKREDYDSLIIKRKSFLAPLFC
jgi:hypothetical protein